MFDFSNRTNKMGRREFKIIHYHLSLYVINMGRCDYFILLGLYNIFIFIQLSLSVCNQILSLSVCNQIFNISIISNKFNLINKLKVIKILQN